MSHTTINTPTDPGYPTAQFGHRAFFPHLIILLHLYAVVQNELDDVPWDVPTAHWFDEADQLRKEVLETAAKVKASCCAALEEAAAAIVAVIESACAASLRFALDRLAAAEQEAQAHDRDMISTARTICLSFAAETIHPPEKTAPSPLAA